MIAPTKARTKVVGGVHPSIAAGLAPSSLYPLAFILHTCRRNGWYRLVPASTGSEKLFFSQPQPNANVTSRLLRTLPDTEIKGCLLRHPSQIEQSAARFKVGGLRPLRTSRDIKPPLSLIGARNRNFYPSLTEVNRTKVKYSRLIAPIRT